MIVYHVCFFGGEATIGTFQVESGWASTMAASIGYVCRIVRYTRAGFESDTTSLKKETCETHVAICFNQDAVFMQVRLFNGLFEQPRMIDGLM